MSYSNVRGSGRGDGPIAASGDGTGVGSGDSKGDGCNDPAYGVGLGGALETGGGHGCGEDGGAEGGGGYLAHLSSGRDHQHLGLWFENHTDIQSSMMLLALSSICKRPHHRV